MRGIPLWGAGSALVLASAQIALPLREEAAAGISSATILGLFSATWAFASMTWGIRRSGLVLGLVFAGAFLVELAGVNTGYPFGEYSYGPDLRPQIGDVPLVVGLAWAGMLVPSYEIARRITGQPVLQCLLVGTCMVVWDLFLDPLMLRYGFWAFAHPSGWQSVPVSNTIGWFVTATALAVIPVRILGLAHRTHRPVHIPDSNARNHGLAFVYVWMISFSALGYLIPFALDDPEIALVGTLCAAPLLFLAFRRKDRSWLESTS